MDVSASTANHLLWPRQSDGSSGGDSTGSQFLKIIADPFSQSFEGKTIISAFYIWIPTTILVALAFCLLRPYHNVVYAPRAKHADSKHAPPPIGKGLFDWIPAVIKIKEHDLVDKVGLDAAVFMRFVRMLRNMFGALTIVGCGILIPVNLVRNKDLTGSNISWSTRLTPQPYFGGSSWWAYVLLAYLFDFIIMFFLWTNYKAVLQLRRSYFESSDYQRSLHARTLMITDIPSDLRSDEGVVMITEQVKATRDVPRGAVARNVKELPDLVEEHDEAVRKLEKVLAKYLKNPDRLPARRPTCKPSKNDRSKAGGGEVDAIDYLTGRIKELENTIVQVRQTVDMRNALSYGFASYEGISDAHSVAYAARKSAPHKTTIRLAPKPSDLIWKNLGISKAARKSKNFTNNLWVGLLTVLWIVPNVLMGAFLSNFNHIGNLSSSFQTSLEAHPTLWALTQAIVAPAISSLVYYYLPALFRRLCQNAGDVRKSSREQHVTHKLYAFFVFNNLIVFSVFSAIFGFITAVISKNEGGDDAWKAIQEAHIFQTLIGSLCSISSYWVSWLLQRNLGAAIDLSQVVGLLWGSLVRRFGSPTPRETIELTAPQPFEYAAYYNYFLFYATVAVAFAPLQPLVLPVVAFYFWMDSYLKKYLLLYIFITKYESGGMFWRSLFNRMLFCAFLGNVIIALLIVAKTTWSGAPDWGMLIALAPLLFIMGGFKWYCMRAFDDKIHYYQTSQTMSGLEDAPGVEGKRRKTDRVGVRFGHPVMFKPLITPMVSAKSQHMLKSIYSGRISNDGPEGYHHGYGDIYMDSMDTQQPGKSNNAHTAPFEIVGENEMDFEHYKNRPEFRDEAGGDGQLFGRSQDQIRSSSPHSMMSLGRTGTSDSFSTLGNAHAHSRSISDSRDRYQGYNSRSGSASREHSIDRAGAVAGGMEYPRGYHPAPSSGLRDHSPAPSDYRENLVGHAAGMGRSTPPSVTRKPMSLGLGNLNAREQFGPGPQGYGMVPGAPPPDHGTPYGNSPYGGTPGEEDAGSYEYFRRGRGL